MNILKSILLCLTLLFVFTGCGGGGGSGDGTSSDENLTKLTVVLPSTTNEITTNNETIDIQVKVIGEENTLYQTGDVYVVYPDSITSGRDIGSFPSSNVAVNNGVATFTYTGPSNITEDTSDIEFSFYHEDNPTVVAKYVATINPAQAAFTSYNLTSSDDGNTSISIESQKISYFNVNNDAGEAIEDSSMVSMTVTSLNPNIGTLEDSDGNTGDSLVITNQNTVAINVKSNTKSGIIPLKVSAVFFDTNNNTQRLSKTFNVIVLSGPPSAISLSYASSENVPDDAKFIEKWVVTVTDKYNNLVNTNPAISMGMITGYVQDSSNTATNAPNYLYFESGASMYASSNKLVTVNDVFENIDQLNETLVTFGDGFTYDASGKWDIASNTADTIYLSDDYDGEDVTEMGFAVGYNHRQDTCEAGVEWVANVYPANGGYTLDDTGKMVINVEYDYYLVGKSTVLSVNLVGQSGTGKSVRIGEGRKITLRGNGLESESVTFAQGDSGIKRIPIKITDTVEYYKNGKFGGYNVIASPTDLNWTISSTSMDNGVTSCANGGVAYVEVMINQPASAPGSLSLENVLPAAEF